MDLNTALMEITSMSECFVAANMRTSFTDLAESGSLGSSQSTMGGGGGGQSSAQSSSDYHNKSSQHQQQQQQQQLHPFSSSPMAGLAQRPMSASGSAIHHHNLVGGPTHHNIHQTASNQHPLGGMGSSNSTSNNHHHHQSGNSHHLHQQQHNHHQSSNSLNSGGQSCNHNNHHHNHSYSATNSIPQHRLTQPTRTQIPIHCYIEQLDACADLPGYNSSITDNELFSTTNKSLPNHGQQNNHSTQYQQSHPPQSKLVLESVTNCNGSASDPLTRNNTSAASRGSEDNETANNSDNNNDDIVGNCNNTTSITTGSSSLFHDSETNNNTVDNDLDSNLDHLNTDSPSSVHHQLTAHQDSTNNISTTFNHRATAAPHYDSPQFQSCRETYAIVTSNVLYIDLLRTVLLQLGYSAMDLINAKATIQIKNWKPLALDQVTDDKVATVGEVLGDISTFVTLRIRLYSTVTQLPTEWTETMIRQVVLALTQTMSQLTLSKLCNISQPLISSIVRGGKKLGRRKCAEFGQWYMNYIKSADARPSTMFCEGGGARLVFDKVREIPQLKAWFANNTKPSDELLEEYSRILNEHALRKDRPHVTAKALRNWWKNERQKLGIRQREIRGRPKLKRID